MEHNNGLLDVGDTQRRPRRVDCGRRDLAQELTVPRSVTVRSVRARRGPEPPRVTC